MIFQFMQLLILQLTAELKIDLKHFINLKFVVCTVLVTAVAHSVKTL